MDPRQQQQFAGAIAGMMGVLLLVGLVIIAFLIFLFWKVLAKAGLSGPLSLLVLIWPIGPLIVLCILAFSEWKVTPIAVSPYYPPVYPPPPPPPAYPPSTTGTF